MGKLSDQISVCERFSENILKSEKAKKQNNKHTIFYHVGYMYMHVISSNITSDLLTHYYSYIQATDVHLYMHSHIKTMRETKNTYGIWPKPIHKSTETNNNSLSVIHQFFQLGYDLFVFASSSNQINLIYELCSITV